MEFGGLIIELYIVLNIIVFVLSFIVYMNSIRVSFDL